MSAVLGAGAALTGLALVFLGIAVSVLQSYASDVPARVLTRHRSGVWVLLVALAAGVGSIGALVAWLLTEGSDAWYAPGIALFLSELVATLAGATLVIVAILRR